MKNTKLKPKWIESFVREKEIEERRWREGCRMWRRRGGEEKEIEE